MPKSPVLAEPAKTARGNNGNGLGTPTRYRRQNDDAPAPGRQTAPWDGWRADRTLMALLNASPDTALLITTNGTILALNETAKKRLAAFAQSADSSGSAPRKRDLIGTCVFDLFPPDLARSRRARDREVIRTGKPLRYEDQRNDQWFDTSIQPVTDPDGKVVALAVFSREVTERKRNEQALAESRETARALLNAPTDTALLIDTKGTIIALNKTATLRLRELAARRRQEHHDLVGLCVFDLFHEDVAATRRARNDEVVRTGRAARFVDKRNGFWFDNTIYPMKDAQGNVARLAIFSRDITDIKQAEEEIRAQAQELSSFNTRLSETAAHLAESQRDLLRLNQELQEERRIVEDLNRDLEMKVRERTADLRRAYR